MPVQLMSVNDAKASMDSLVQEALASKEAWSYQCLRDTQCELVYVVRDGVEAHSGERAAHERPSRANQTEIRYRMQVQPHMTNMFGTVHGGCLATIIDTLSTNVIALHSSGDADQPWLTYGVSQTLTVHYLRPTRVGTWIELAVRAMSIGKTLAQLETSVYELEGDKNSARRHRTAFSTHAKVDVSKRMAKL